MIPVLFSAALVGLLVVLGIAVAQLGWVALASYLVLVVALLGVLVRRQRTQPDGRTCTCCTSTVFDEVEVR